MVESRSDVESFPTDKPVLADIMNEAQLLKEERKKLTSFNLALVLVHDMLLSGGIQAGDGPVKQAVLRHKTRLHGELQKLKIRRGVRLNEELAQVGDSRAGTSVLLSKLSLIVGILRVIHF